MINPEEFAQRQAKLLAQLPANSLCVLAAADLKIRSRDTEYPFRQDSDFFYLCGFPEPEAWLLLSNRPEQPQVQLFCQDKDPEQEIWHGRRIGPEQAEQDFAVEVACSLEELEEHLLAQLNGANVLYFAQGHNAEVDAVLFDCLAQLRSAPKQSLQAPNTLCDIRPVLHDMRLFKSAAEIALMKKAAQISADAHQRAMATAKPGMFEYQLEAELHHEFVYQGARNPAYGTIVGGGENATILHYTANSEVLNDGDLVLIDAGAEYHGYAADITRTFPVNGRFSEPQRALYQWVLKAQLAAIEHIKPGNTLQQATDISIRIVTEGLIALGLLNGSVDEHIERKTYRDFYMHGLGHWLGLDVHDVGDYKVHGEPRPLQPGMVLTIEPGIYISADANVDPKWRGMGIRIEDNVLVTETGCEVITAAVPKTVEAIEAWMAQQAVNDAKL